MGTRSLLLLLPLLLSLSGPARALTFPLRFGEETVGSLSTEGPRLSNAPFGNGGVNFWANWSLLPGTVTVTAGDLRWLQRVTFSPSVVEFPDRPFIDPRQGQDLGSLPAGADALPWYDVSGPGRNSLSLQGGGDDPWLGDGPYAPYSRAPLAFSADTLVVAIDDAAKQAVMLGGVRWGYALSTLEGDHTTSDGPSPLADSIALRAAFNTALTADFPGWTLVAVPEPSTALLLLWGLLTLCVARRGSRSPRG